MPKIYSEHGCRHRMRDRLTGTYICPFSNAQCSMLTAVCCKTNISSMACVWGCGKLYSINPPYMKLGRRGAYKVSWGYAETYYVRPAEGMW
jgi:hypothetical protein